MLGICLDGSLLKLTRFSGNTWSGAGFVVAGDAIPHFAFVKAFCSRHCVNVHKADHPAVLSEQVVVLSTDPVVAAYDTPVPFHHQPYFVEPRFESCSTRYTGNYHAIGKYQSALGWLLTTDSVLSCNRKICKCNKHKRLSY